MKMPLRQYCIGNTNGYLTLEAAVAAATNGAVVKLVKDTSENIIIPNSKTIVIDLNGKKLTNADSHTIVNNGNLTIQGSGTVDNVTHQKAALVNYGTAVLNGGTYTRSLENPENNKDNSGGNSYYTILNDKGGNMTINAGVEVTNVGHFSSMICNGGDANSSAMSKLTIHGGVFSGGINTVKNDELGELTITDGSFSNASQCVIMNWHKANISGGTFETNEGAETVLFTAKYHDTRAIGKLTLTGGTYICKTDQALLCDRYNNNEEYLGTASIAGGTFSRQPEEKYIAAGYVATANTNGTWTVGAAASATFAAQVGGVMYTTLAAALAAADENAIVELLGDVDGQVVIPAGKKLTLDLDGKTTTYSGTAIINNGTLIVKNGAVVSTGNCGIGVGNNSETTILSDVTVTAQESAVITSTSTGAKIYIEGGTFTSTDNAVIAGNGSAREGNPNIIVINGGTFNGGITTADYVACGIYAPWKDQITVNGGTFNITGGAGIVARAGQVTVDGGTFICTGNATGKVGDSRVVVPCAALVFDSEANYPALTGESVILVKSGSFTVQSGVAVAQAVKAENDLNPRISIKGGSFSSGPTAYVAEGYKAVENGDGTWVVRKKENNAQVGGKNYEELSDAIEASNSINNTITLTKNTTVKLENGVANGSKKCRNITIKGDGTQTVDVITRAISAEGGMLSYQRGSTFTFENVTVQAGEGNFDGIVCDELTYKNCTIKGKLTLFGKATFTNCVFDNTMANQYSIWTWGSTDVTFEGCTFNTNGKAILLYGGADGKNPTSLVVNNCTFNDRNNGAAGKAAIEIGNDYNATYSLTVTNATVNGFANGKNTNSKLWANKNSMRPEHLSVTIDGTKVF